MVFFFSFSFSIFLLPSSLQKSQLSLILYSEAVQDCFYWGYVEFGHLWLPNLSGCAGQGRESQALVDPTHRTAMPLGINSCTSPGKENSVGKGKASKAGCWAKPFSHGRRDPHHVGAILSLWKIPKSRQSFQKHSAPACAATESFILTFAKRLLRPSSPGYCWEGLGSLNIRVLQNELKVPLKNARYYPHGIIQMDIIQMDNPWDHIHMFLGIWAR